MIALPVRGSSPVLLDLESSYQEARERSGL